MAAALAQCSSALAQWPTTPSRGKEAQQAIPNEKQTLPLDASRPTARVKAVTFGSHTAVLSAPSFASESSYCRWFANCSAPLASAYRFYEFPATTTTTKITFQCVWKFYSAAIAVGIEGQEMTTRLGNISQKG